MKLLTRNTDYAVRAICYMATHRGEVVAVPAMVEELKIPRPFLRKILQTLSKDRIITSRRGVGGGFQLALPADKILLTELIRIFQGPVKVSECLFKKKVCPNIKVCPLKKKLGAIERYVESELKAITIGELLK